MIWSLRMSYKSIRKYRCYRYPLIVIGRLNCCWTVNGHNAVGCTRLQNTCFPFFLFFDWNQTAARQLFVGELWEYSIAACGPVYPTVYRPDPVWEASWSALIRTASGQNVLICGKQLCVCVSCGLCGGVRFVNCFWPSCGRTSAPHRLLITALIDRFGALICGLWPVSIRAVCGASVICMYVWGETLPFPRNAIVALCWLCYLERAKGWTRSHCPQSQASQKYISTYIHIYVAI